MEIEIPTHLLHPLPREEEEEDPEELPGLDWSLDVYRKRLGE